MAQKIRMITSIWLTILPGFLKKFLYRVLFGYRIGRGARIGLAILDCRSLEIGDDARIGHGTVFWRCGEVQIGKKAVIGPLNIFRGGERLRLGDYAMVLRLNTINAIPDNDCVNEPQSVFELGYGSVITAEHRIDFTDRVEIGDRSILGGRNSSIWTHNRRKGHPVTIGRCCYVGSEIRMAPGSAVPNYSIVGLGSVITQPLTEEYTLIAGVPAKTRRLLNEEDRELIFGKTRKDLPD